MKNIPKDERQSFSAAGFLVEEAPLEPVDASVNPWVAVEPSNAMPTKAIASAETQTSLRELPPVAACAHPSPAPTSGRFRSVAGEILGEEMSRTTSPARSALNESPTGQRHSPPPASTERRSRPMGRRGSNSGTNVSNLPHLTPVQFNKAKHSLLRQHAANLAQIRRIEQMLESVRVRQQVLLHELNTKFSSGERQ